MLYGVRERLSERGCKELAYTCGSGLQVGFVMRWLVGPRLEAEWLVKVRVGLIASLLPAEAGSPEEPPS